MEKAYAAWRAFQDRVLAPAAALLLRRLHAARAARGRAPLRPRLSFEWQQDAVTFFILSGVFLYFSIAQRHDAHLTVTLIPELLDVLGARWRRAAEVVKLIALVFSCAVHGRGGVVGHPGGRGQHQVREPHREPGVPDVAVPGGAAVGFAFMAITMLFQIYRAVQKLRGRTVLEEPARRRRTATH